MSHAFIQLPRVERKIGSKMLALFLQLCWILPVVSFRSRNHLAPIELCQLKHEVERLEALEGNVLREYTTVWSVNVPEGREAADEIAKQHGFINTGPVILFILIVQCT